MKPSQIAAALDAAINQNNAVATMGGRDESRISLFLEGPPGGGKSSLVKQAAARHDMGVIDLRLVQLDPVDLRGIPSVVAGRTVWNAPDELPSDPDWKGILFLDELPQAVPLVQNTVSQLVLDRCIGDYRLPDGVVIMAAGNPRSSRAATHEMPRHLANRFVFLSVDSDVDDFNRWGAANGICPELTSFFKVHDDMLHKFDAAQRCNPSPRAWNFVNSILTMNLEEFIQQSMIYGAVGEAAGRVFEGHLRLAKQIPDIDMIIADPSGSPIPSGKNGPGIMYMLMSKLSRRLDKGNSKAIVQYIDRLPPEQAAVCIKEAIARDKTLEKDVSVLKWSAAHFNLIVG
jgi:hypothetical protein